MLRSFCALLIVTLLGWPRGQVVDATAIAKGFIEDLAGSKYDAASSRLDPSLTPSPEKIKQLWARVQSQVGTFRAITETRTERMDTTIVVFVTCEFERMKLDGRLPVNAKGLILGMTFAQHVDYVAPDYVKPDLFREQEVRIGKAPWAVHGSLAIPKGPGPFRAVVMMTGSGNNDSDSTLGPNKVFRDLAWGLASHGIAVLRCDKRPHDYPAEFAKLSSFTVNEEYVEDAESACEFLRSTPRIDRNKVFLLGHSLGGTVAPRVAKRVPYIAGLVLLAPTSRNLLDIIVPQYIYNFQLKGAMTDAQQKFVAQLGDQIARAKDPNLKPDAPLSGMPLGVPASYWIDLRDYHPTELARTLPQPMLILRGERDYQITSEDFMAWKTGLAGRKDVEFRTYPKLNHLFLSGEGPSSDDEYLKPGHVPGTVVEDIAAWLKKH